MAGPRGEIQAGRAFVELYLKNAKLLKGLKDAQQRLRDFGNGMASVGKGMMGMGAAITAPLLAAAKLFSDVGSKLNDMSKRTGASTEALSELGYAAELSGSSIEGVETSLKKMQKTIGEAGTGNKQAIASISQLGISLKELEGKSPEQQLEIFADALSKISDPAKRTAFAMDIFGKSGTELLPIMDRGAAGIREMRAEAIKLGLSIGADQAKAADDLGDAWDRMAKATKAAVFQIGAAMSGPVIEIVDSIKNIMVNAGAWSKQNGDIIIQAAKIGLELIAMGAAFYGVGKAIAAAGATIGAFRTAIQLISTAGVGLTAGMSLVAIGLGAIAAAFVNAKLKGISFGESVLDLTHQLTGLDNAYSKLQYRNKRENRMSAGVANIEGGGVAESKAGVATLRNEREALQQQVKNLNNQIESLAFVWEWDPVVKSVRAEIKALNTEISLLDSNINRLKNVHLGNLVKGGVKGGISSVFNSLMGAGSSAGATMKPYFDRLQSFSEAAKDAQLEIRRIQAGGIADPQARDMALANLDYDAKRKKIMEDAREGKGGAEQIFFNEAMRAAELAKIKEQYDREAAEKRLAIETDTNDEIARLKIETSTKGKDKDLALLRLKQQKEMEEARKAGADLNQLKEKHSLEAQLLGLKDVKKNMGKVAGTFSKSELAGMGMGNPQERIVRAVERQLAKNDRIIKINEDMLKEQKRLTLESVA